MAKFEDPDFIKLEQTLGPDLAGQFRAAKQGMAKPAILTKDSPDHSFRKSEASGGTVGNSSTDTNTTTWRLSENERGSSPAPDKGLAQKSFIQNGDSVCAVSSKIDTEKDRLLELRVDCQPISDNRGFQRPAPYSYKY